MRIRRVTTVAAAAALVVTALGACSSNGSGGGGGNSADGGGTVTMWARSGNPTTSKLVARWNADHKTKVRLTLIPGDSFITKVATAAGSRNLPDVLVSDVVYSPNYVKQGLYRDMTDVVNKLPFKSSLVKAHLDAATANGKTYAVPFDVDSSILLYNKGLFKKAGLDPEKAPKTFDDIYNDAKAVRKLGGKTYGFYFAGSCAGCFSYTGMPIGAAAGDPPVSQDGKTANVNSPAIKAMAALYGKLYKEGIAPSAVKSEDGSTWGTSFRAGQIGILPLGSGDLAPDRAAGVDVGVAALPAPDGSATSTFVGGDVVGVTSTAKNPTGAQSFVTWSLGKTAQVEVWAKNGYLTARTDLSDNKYSSKIPGVPEIIKGLANGYTPASTKYGDIFNNANGPWLQGLRGAIFQGDPGALDKAQTTIQAELSSGN